MPPFQQDLLKKFLFWKHLHFKPHHNISKAKNMQNSGFRLQENVAGVDCKLLFFCEFEEFLFMYLHQNSLNTENWEINWN